MKVLGGDCTPKHVHFVSNVMNICDVASMTRKATAARNLLLDSIPEHGGDNNDQNPARYIQSDPKIYNSKTWSTDLSTVNIASIPEYAHTANTNTPLPAVRKYNLFMMITYKSGLR